MSSTLTIRRHVDDYVSDTPEWWQNFVDYVHDRMESVGDNFFALVEQELDNNSLTLNLFFDSFPVPKEIVGDEKDIFAFIVRWS